MQKKIYKFKIRNLANNQIVIQVYLNPMPFNVKAFEETGNLIRPEVGSVADGVGVYYLRMARCNPTKRILWDNREHQFWKEYQGSFRPRLVPVKKHGSDEKPHLKNAWVEFECDGIQTIQRWEFHDVDEKEPFNLFYDCFVTVNNVSHIKKEDCLFFFACYHVPGTSYFWSINDKIVPCAQTNFTGVQGLEEETRLRSTPYFTHIKKYLRKGDYPRFDYWKHPILLSAGEKEFGNKCHVVVVNEENASAIHVWRSQARDYMIKPQFNDLERGEEFTAHIRHYFTTIEGVEDLRRLWKHFSEA